MFKWLGIAIIVLVGFLVVLLGLGYLLKENKAKTTVLKHKLDQQAYSQQLKQQKQSDRQKVPSSQIFTAVEQSLKQIISLNLSCQTNKQCILFETGSKLIGCTVAVNTKGAAILIRVASISTDSSLAKACLTTDLSLTTACINQGCIIQ
ncbi:MAG: hypothetical protein MJK12_03235 [Colwellia sp.]|nr:hypothetical protein [Colwellia sp.]